MIEECFDINADYSLTVYNLILKCVLMPQADGTLLFKNNIVIKHNGILVFKEDGSLIGINNEFFS